MARRRIPAVREHLADRERLSWWVSFVVMAALGGLWALATPLMGAPDEPAHAVRAVAVADGQLRGRDVMVRGAANGIDGLQSHFVVPAAYSDLRSKACFAFAPTVTASCAEPVGDATSPTDAISYAGTYPPLYYALVGWPSRLLDPTEALYAMRLCSVAVGAALLASALGSARRAAPDGLGVTAVALLATPMVFFLLGSINPSGFEIAAAAATGAALLELLTRPGPVTTRSLVRAGVATTCVVAARPSGLLMGGLVVLGVLAMVATPRRLRTLLGDRRVVVTGVLVGVATALSVAWVLWARTLDALVGQPVPGLTHADAVREAWRLEPWRTRQMFGVFGWFDVPLPWGMVWPWLIAVAVIFVAAAVVGTWRQRAVLVGWLAVCLVVPLLSEAARAADVGLYWQGRYTLPLAVVLPILSAWVVATSGRLPRPVSVGAGVVVAVAMAGGQLLAHAIALTRYVVADPGRPAFAYLGGTGWDPPLGVGGQFAASVVICAAYGGWLALSAGRDPGGGPGRRTDGGGDEHRGSRTETPTPAVA